MIRKALLVAAAPAAARGVSGAGEAASPPDLFQRQGRLQLSGRHLDGQRERLRRAAPHRQQGARHLPALLAGRQLDRLFLQSRRQLRRVRDRRGRRQAAPAHLPHARTTTWSDGPPDGKKVLFSSTRAQGRVPDASPRCSKCPVDGGIEQPVPTDWGASGSYSPDGKKLAFMRHPVGLVAQALSRQRMRRTCG